MYLNRRYFPGRSQKTEKGKDKMSRVQKGNESPSLLLGICFLSQQTTHDKKVSEQGILHQLTSTGASTNHKHKRSQDTGNIDFEASIWKC